MRALLLLALLPGLAAADPVFVPLPTAPGHTYPVSYCTNRGERVETGETACLRVGGRSFTARCGISLNNPTWREVKDGCDPAPRKSRAPASLQPIEPG